ncbi:hypothetical protein GTA08_BOTSDO03294 [Botryosphaeria dothidea]|uniref:Uncharacterized protein n=1 Tax=Botryosphaeria dothidea TaxID=55169 RepID=A0A8H4IZP8_9PEZI|nr:hypothetical protein GTA08_BOTSDO03294 [Botryosphaeria dothidea]
MDAKEKAQSPLKTPLDDPKPIPNAHHPSAHNPTPTHPTQPQPSTTKPCSQHTPAQRRRAIANFHHHLLAKLAALPPLSPPAPLLLHAKRPRRVDAAHRQDAALAQLGAVPRRLRAAGGVPRAGRGRVPGGRGAELEGECALEGVEAELRRAEAM